MSSPTPTSASCNGHTSSNVRLHDLDTLAKNLMGYTISIHIFHLGFVALLYHRQGLPSMFKHHLCGIKTCLTTHAAYACMFYHARHNNVASHRYLDFQQHDPCIVMQSHVLRYSIILIFLDKNCCDSLAEWSKAPDLGSGPNGRRFKSHSCHDHTFSNVWPRDLDTLTINLKEYSISIHIFHPLLYHR